MLPLVTSCPTSHWITVGDGNFGSDAHFLGNRGINVVATSISTETLTIAHERGWISAYAAENAESFSLPDNAVDFVLCKEALHHLPRPPIGLYEMLRIASRAVVLIEPIEGNRRPLMILKRMAKRLLRGNVTQEFETSGNYLYRVNIREIQKMLAGIDLRFLAWKGINDFCYGPVAGDRADHWSPGFCFTRSAIIFQDCLAKAGFMNFGLSAIVCFKSPPMPICKRP